MLELLGAVVAAVGRFALPWLFAAWLFVTTTTILPLSWPVGVSAGVAILAGYLLQKDAKVLLERYCRFDEAAVTPGTKGGRPEAKLRGLTLLLEMHTILACALTIGFQATVNYLRSYGVPFGLGNTSEMRMILAVGVASVLGYIAYVGWRKLVFRQTSSILRGQRVGTLKDARQKLATQQEPGEPEIAWGGVGLPWSSGPRHFLAAGMTGSGKTNLLLQFMASVLVWIGRKPDQRALVYDPKTELLSFLHGLGLGPRVRILHPLDIRGCAWNLAADITSATAAQQVAAVLIPEEKESKNPYFSIAAQQLLAGVFTFLSKSAPGKWDLRDAIFIMERMELLRQALERYPETAGLVDEYFQPEDTFANVRSTVANWMRRYRPIAACWHRAAEKVSLEDWIRGEYVLLLGQDDSIRVQMDAINRALFTRATQLILRGSDSPTRRTWLIVDEVRELGQLDGLSRFLNTARSKGACFCGGYQTPSGMKAAVGDHIADEINDNIWNWALCRMGGDVSAEWASKLVGEVEFEETTESVGPGGKNTSTSIAKRRALLPEYFMQLPPPSPKAGVSGVFITLYTDAYTYAVPGPEIATARRLARADVPNFLPRPKDHQELIPWTEDDYRRVRLTPVQHRDRRNARTTNESNRPRVVGRVNRDEVSR